MKRAGATTKEFQHAVERLLESMIATGRQISASFIRLRVLRSSFFVFLALASPGLVCAQFQQPNDEELKMTADPKAPGAAAVYLDIEEIANDPIHYQSYYARIKVLTEKGKELATVELPYLKGGFKITDIKGRTIHPDGTVIPLTVKPEDLLVAKDGEMQVQRKVFTLPSVEVDSILEYKYELHYDDHHYSSPKWLVQRPYLVHKAHYEFTPAKNFLPGPQNATSVYLVDDHGNPADHLICWTKLTSDVKVQKEPATGRFTVDVTDVPAIPDEERMPPIESFLDQVRFYYIAASDVQAFWMSEGKYWSKDVNHFAELSEAIKTAVGGLIAPGDSELDKAKKLYAAVQALDNTDYSRKKSESERKQLKLKEAKHAEDTWAQKSGSSEDIAMLYLAMLRAAGLTAYANKVVDRDRGVFDISYMTMEQLDTTLVALEIGGKQLVLDPGEKMCPFGTLNWRHSSAVGVGQSAKGVSVASTPPQQYKDNQTTRSGNLTLDAQGGVTGNITIAMTGQSALSWRQAALGNDDAEVKKQFDHDLEEEVPDGVEAHVDHFLGMDQPDVKLIAMVKVKGSLGTATTRRLMLPGLFFESRGHVPFVNEEKRLEPVDMHYADQVTDDITYHLPAGMSVEGAPPDANISWQGHAIMVVKSKVEPGQIVIGNTLAVGFTLAKPEEYQDLRGFYQKVASTEQEELVLTAAPATQAAPAVPAAQVTPVAPAGKGN